MFESGNTNSNILGPPALPARHAACALFLDVDGTLLDFAPEPDLVRVDAQLSADLALLRSRMAVALLSGRSLAQLDALFDWTGCPAGGLHGAELRWPDGREQHPSEDAAFAAVRRKARALTNTAPGVRLADKRHALPLHYRGAPEARTEAQRIARELAQTAGKTYALQRGNQVIELKPAGASKGRALAALATAAPFAGKTPWVLGDDLNDESAFREAQRRGGVSIIVGDRRPTVARHALPGPAAVRHWLHRLARRVQREDRQEVRDA